MDFLSVGSLPWLGPAQRRVQEAWAAHKLPHSLLLLAQAGLGADRLAGWIAAFTLCESPAQRPCGSCPSCVLLQADNHPDLKVVRLEDDAQQIKVDQIRELIESLSLASYRGGYKVAIVESAEALNVNAANAFLKTLEEPTRETLLILVARPSHRLPATIVSRCLRLGVKAPERAVALSWLEAQRPQSGGWNAALVLAGGAPLGALQLDAEEIKGLDEQMSRAVGELAAGAIDVSLLAESWLRAGAEARLAWLENWITHRIRAASGAGTSPQSAEPVRLSAALLKSKIQALFEWLDSLRELRRLASTGVNQQLALEAFLLEGRAALAR